jgi:hypothetical protein
MPSQAHYLSRLRLQGPSFRDGILDNPLMHSYNPLFGATASLLWKNLHSFFDGRGRLREMMEWADKIDSARYESVNEAIFGDARFFLSALTTHWLDCMTHSD